MSSGSTQDADTIADILSSRLFNGESDPVAALVIADRYFGPAFANFINAISKVRGAASYATLANLATHTDDQGVTILPRPPYLSDDQFLRLYKGLHSLYVLWDKFKFSPVPDPSVWAFFEPALIFEWMEKWFELTNSPAISNFGETDILGRLRYVQAMLGADTWSDPASATILVRMVDHVIEEMEKNIIRHF